MILEKPPASTGCFILPEPLMSSCPLRLPQRFPHGERDNCKRGGGGSGGGCSDVRWQKQTNKIQSSAPCTDEKTEACRISLTSLSSHTLPGLIPVLLTTTQRWLKMCPASGELCGNRTACLKTKK